MLGHLAASQTVVIAGSVNIFLIFFILRLLGVRLINQGGSFCVNYLNPVLRWEPKIVGPEESSLVPALTPPTNARSMAS